MPIKRYDDELLHRLRNEIPTDWLIEHLAWPNKHREGRFAFVCPRCGETDSAVKRDTNLGRCFHCETNFNTRLTSSWPLASGTSCRRLHT